MALRIADLAVDTVHVGADPVSAVYIGADQVWSAVTPQRIVKSQAQLIAAALTPANPELLVAWTPDAGSSVESNGVRVSSVGGNIRVVATMTMSVITAAAHSRGLHLYANGVKVAEQTIDGFTTEFQLDVVIPANAQLLTLRAHATASNTANRNVTAAVLRYEQA